MQQISQEHLDKLIDRQNYLRLLVGTVNKKINHRNWAVSHDFGMPLTLKAREQLMEELCRVNIEIDFLMMQLQE